MMYFVSLILIIVLYFHLLLLIILESTCLIHQSNFSTADKLKSLFDHHIARIGVMSYVFWLLKLLLLIISTCLHRSVSFTFIGGFPSPVSLLHVYLLSVKGLNLVT